jgi:predicted nucleic acid-binding protein
MDTVVNASPIIFLSKINRLYLLNSLFDKIYVPQAVVQEIKANDTTDTKDGLAELSLALFEVSNRVAVRSLLGRLHIGEVEVIIGAIEKDVQLVILDDNAARNKAKQLGLATTGTLGILLKAKKLGLIEDLSQEILKLKDVGMYMSDNILERILDEYDG